MTLLSRAVGFTRVAGTTWAAVGTPTARIIPRLALRGYDVVPVTINQAIAAPLSISAGHSATSSIGITGVPVATTVPAASGFSWGRAVAVASVASSVFGLTATCEPETPVASAEAPAASSGAIATAGGAESGGKKRPSGLDALGPIVTNPELRDKIHKLSSEFGDSLNKFFDTGVPQQITAGFTAGFAMGYAAKKSAKIATVVIGVLVFTVQALSFGGYVDTNWENVSEDFVGWLDANGDGKFDSEDVKMLWTRFANVAGYNLPAGSGWAGGLVMGFRAG
eukprot:m.137428 g.137428  ORF g.137428 m.137428 type:complete len:280 (+) comp13973_c0_seq2:1929-2768(+)